MYTARKSEENDMYVRPNDFFRSNPHNFIAEGYVCMYDAAAFDSPRMLEDIFDDAEGREIR